MFEALEDRSLLAVDLISKAAVSFPAGNHDSTSPSISADGRYIVFASEASNLVPGDNNDASDIFVKDIVTGEQRLVSTSVDGMQGDGSSSVPSISANGRFVAFYSRSRNFVRRRDTGIYVKDLETESIVYASVNSTGHYSSEGADSRYAPTVSSDGRYVAFVSSNSNLISGVSGSHVFVKDLQTRAVTLVSADSAGNVGNDASLSPKISSDGRYVAFTSYATNLVAGDMNGQRDVFVKDLQTGETILASADSIGIPGNKYSDGPNISANGQYVSFASYSDNLISGDNNFATDIFRKNLATGEIDLVSVTKDGTQGYSSSNQNGISSDGRYVVFASDGRNFGTGTNDYKSQIFRKDLLTGDIVLISTDSSGALGNDFSRSPAISTDGNTVAFQSQATNWIPGDIGNHDIFVKTLDTQSLHLITADHGEPRTASADDHSYLPALSSDGRFVAFVSESNDVLAGETSGAMNLYLQDRTTGAIQLVNADASGERQSFDYYSYRNASPAYVSAASISADGRYVAFSSNGRYPGTEDTNGRFDIFVKDMLTGSVVLASSDADGTQFGAECTKPSLTPDGQFVAFQVGSKISGASISFPSEEAIYLKNLRTGELTLVSSDELGMEANAASYEPSISADGRYIAFTSNATNLVPDDTNSFKDVFVKDMLTGAVVRASTSAAGVQGRNRSFHAKISANGRYIAFVSLASNLVSKDSNSDRDVFVKDLETGAITRATIDIAGNQLVGNTYSYPDISADGRFITFSAKRGVFDDNISRIYIKDILTGSLTMISETPDETPVNSHSTWPVISDDGKFVAFASEASNLAANDFGGYSDVFVADVFPDNPFPAQFLTAFDPTSANWYGSDLENGNSFTLANWDPRGGWRDGLVADFNGDGVSDIAARNLSGQWVVGTAAPDSFDYFTEKIWANLPFQRTYASVQTGDVNGDGMADIVIFNQSNANWLVLTSNGHGFETQVVRWGSKARWLDFQVADFNGDGKDDLAARSLSQVAPGTTWWVSLANRNGQIQSKSRWDQWQGNNWVDVQAADFDGNGKTDLVARNRATGQWQWSRSNGRRFKSHDLGANARQAKIQWQNVLIADLNGDGKDDIVGQDEIGRWFWIHQGKKRAIFSASLGRWQPDDNYQSIFTADLDQDGKDELFGRRGTNGVWRIDQLNTSEKSLRTLRGSARQPAWDETADWLFADLGFDGRDLE